MCIVCRTNGLRKLGTGSRPKRLVTSNGSSSHVPVARPTHCGRGCFPPASETPGPDEIALALSRCCLLADERNEFSEPLATRARALAVHFVAVWSPGEAARAAIWLFPPAVLLASLLLLLELLAAATSSSLDNSFANISLLRHAYATANTLEHTMPGAQRMMFMRLLISE